MLAGSIAPIVALVTVALIFDFLNGLHDAANSIATVVSTRVLSPNIAVIWAAFFNFIAFLFFGLHVAQTIGTGLHRPRRPRLARHLQCAHGCAPGSRA
jgi:PiT family inorganic phosphate transporter